MAGKGERKVISMERKEISNVVDLKRVRITDAFWKKEIELVRDTVIPYQWEALNDRVPDAQPSYCMRNFEVAGRINRRMAEKADYVKPVYTTNGFCVWPDDPEKRFCQMDRGGELYSMAVSGSRIGKNR